MSATIPNKRQRLTSEHREELLEPSFTANLPTELLVSIFEQAAPFDPPFTSLKIAQVCRLWRRCALELPSLWSNTLNLCSLYKNNTEEESTRFTELLALCAERSNGLTHVDASDVVTSQRAFATISDSVKTIVDLRIGDRSICQCETHGLSQWGHGHTPREDCPWDVGTYLGLNYEEIFDLIMRACNLECLRIKLLFHKTVSYREVEPDPEDRPPRPHTVSVFIAHSGFWMPKLRKRIMPWLDDVTDNAEHLDFEQYEQIDDGDWPSWTWDLFIRRAKHLRTIRLSAESSSSFGIGGITHLPLMQAMTLQGGDVPYGAERYPIWFEVPALQQLRTSVLYAQHLRAPSVAHALLYISDHRDLDNLTQVLNAWTHLETLTIVVNTGLSDDFRRDEKNPFDDILPCLTELASETGTLRAPKLRHLGFIVSPSYNRPELWKKRWSIWHDADWPRMPWTEDEAQHRYEDGVAVIQRSSGVPWRVAGLGKLEEQRRLLATGKGEEGLASPGQPACVPLETIKLAGIPVSQAQWEDLTTRDTHTRFMCYPDPK